MRTTEYHEGWFSTGTNLYYAQASGEFFIGEEPFVRVLSGSLQFTKLTKDTIVWCAACGTGEPFNTGVCSRCGRPYSEEEVERSIRKWWV